VAPPAAAAADPCRPHDAVLAALVGRRAQGHVGVREGAGVRMTHIVPERQPRPRRHHVPGDRACAGAMHAVAQAASAERSAASTPSGCSPICKCPQGRFIKEEFNAFLECGILAHGFLRLRCGECGHDKLLAFGCKRRGFCPSCGARRMSQTASHLVDHVIPHVPVRQWVLSLPIALRLLLAAQPELVTPVLQVVQRVVMRHLLASAGLKADEGRGGAVTLVQRFGSAANLNIHLRCLVLDGVYRCDADGVPIFVEAAVLTDDGCCRRSSRGS
jgi:Transposase zinc-binding domain